MKLIVVIAAAVGVSFYLIAMYACLVVASQMDDEMDLYRREREEHDGDNGDEEKSGQTGSAGDRETTGETLRRG